MTAKTIEVRQDVWKIRRALSRMVDDQIPFATAVALTKTAKDAQQALRRDLSRDFTIRSHWTTKGIRIIPARKRHWPNQVAQVGSRDRYMAMQAMGGTKRGRSGGRVAIPVGARRRPTQRTPRRKWPSRMLQNPKFFTLRLRNGGVGVFRRYAAGRGSIKLQWWIVRSVKVPRRWPIYETTESVVRRRFHVHAIRELKKAIRLR